MKSLPLERKVLTVSARDYCKSKGKKLKDYQMVGVHYIGNSVREIPNYFFDEVPNAEVVVKYHPPTDNGSNGNLNKKVIFASGTALIPKKKK